MSHEPPTPHDPGSGPEHGRRAPAPEPAEGLSGVLTLAQFFVTGLVLVVIASLAYVAGMQSARGGGHGGAAKPAGGAGAKVDVGTLLKSTPELVAEGKAVFEINCASCHGTGGKGDGPAAAALNPKPQNFTDQDWKYGGGVARIVRTVSEGSPGTGMAAFTSIPMRDRFALAHFIRSLNTTQQEDKPDDLAWLGPTEASSDTGKAGGPAPGAPVQPAGPAIPIEQAIASLAEPEPTAGVALPAAADPGAGASLFAQRCVSCHGTSGEGGRRVRMLGSAPYAYWTTKGLGAAHGTWITDAGAFERLVLNGIPGYAMPANGDLSREDLRDLHGYTLKLRALQQSARRTGS